MRKERKNYTEKKDNYTAKWDRKRKMYTEKRDNYPAKWDKKEKMRHSDREKLERESRKSYKNHLK